MKLEKRYQHLETSELNLYSEANPLKTLISVSSSREQRDHFQLGSFKGQVGVGRRQAVVLLRTPCDYT
jgi:hypothetical protein